MIFMKNWYGSLHTTNPNHHTIITSGSGTAGPITDGAIILQTAPRGLWTSGVIKEMGNPITLVKSNNGTYIFYSIKDSDHKALLGIVYED